MPLPFNPFGLFQPPKSKVSPYGGGLPINRFGYGQPLPPTEPTQPDNTDEFMAEYNRVTNNRPQRLAYQQAVDQGPEQIHRGKWAMLGGALTAAGANLGGESPTNAAKLAMSAYDRPQDRADQDYKERILRLGQSANMEQQDIEDRLKALEFSTGEKWKQKDYGLRVKEGERSQSQLDLQAESTHAQVARINKEMEDADLYDYTDPETGWTVVKDKQTGKIVSIKGHTQQSPDEKAATEGKIAGARATAELPSELEKIKAQGTERIAQIKAQNDARAAIARAKLDAAINNPKADEAYKRMAVNLRAALFSDSSLAQYLKPGPDGNLIPMDESDYWLGMPDEAKAGITKLKAAVLAPPPKAGDITPASNTAATTPNAAGKTLALPPGFSITDPATGKEQPATAAPAAGVNSIPISNEIPPSLFGQGIQLPPPPANPANTTIRGMRGVPMGSANINIPTPSIPEKVYGPYGQVIARPADAFKFQPPPSQPAGNPAGEFQAPSDLFGYNTQPPIAPPPPPVNNIPISNRVNPALFGQGIQLPGPPPNAAPPNIPRAVPTPIPSTNVPPPSGSIPPGVLAGLAPPPPRMGPSETVAPPPNIASRMTGPTPTAPAPNIPPEVEFNAKLGSISKRFQDVTGLGLKIISARRTAEQQGKIFAQNTPDRTVTNADGTKVLSKHQTGEAADITFIDPKTGKVVPGLLDSKGRPTKTGQQLYDSFGKIAKEEGLVWGGDWVKPYDPGHVQLGAVLTRPQTR